MDVPTSKIRSLSRSNRFAFACPIFGTEVELRGCVRLHDLHMVNKGPETRRGCQAAMSSSKCPVWHIAQLTRQGRDEWHSETLKVGTLGQDVISRIARVQTSEKTITEFQVPAREGQLLLEANRMWERDDAKPKGKPGRPVAIPSLPEPADPIAKSPDSEVAKAAASGDLGKALTMAAEAENVSPSAKAHRRPKSPPAPV